LHERRIIALDGEGYTTKRGKHLYTYMAACDADGLVDELSDPRGIKFPAFADWLLGLSGNALLVGYSLGYDRCKWLESLPDDIVYSVEHPEGRQTQHGPKRVRHGEYLLNQVATRFSLGRVVPGETRSKGWRDGVQRRVPKCKTRVVWDVFRFYQSSFVKALSRWDIGTPEERERIEAMKQRRGKFRGIDRREREYCQAECRLLARLVRELLDAHQAEGITLTQLYGPGSTASVVLKSMGADQQRAELSPELEVAVATAYFGGRFECSHVGPVTGALYGYDIASAYPFAMSRLPCMAHGHFERVHGSHALDAITDPAPALVSYRIEPSSRMCEAWGPLPHRLADGNIVFPIESAGGWAWNVEVAMAHKLHSGVIPLAVWQWQRSCDCPPPFRATIERLYQRRREMGKGARGIVLKLALNSLYGKSAQRVGGGGAFRCLVRAGLITAMTRAMLLGAVLTARDPWNILELATDSVLSRQPLPALPLGTELGAWEAKAWPRGAFLVRPGMRFALEPDENKVAARGLGIRTLSKNRERVLRAWEREPMAPLTLQQPSMFHGSKSSLWRVPEGEGWEYRRSALYGTWSDPTPRVLSYAPGPKRSGIMASPIAKRAIALVPWRLPAGLRSVPYASPAPSEEDLLRLLETEQPEAGYLDCL
jgi:hypothetical protein